MRTKSHLKWLLLAAIAAGVPIACDSSEPPSGSSGTGSTGTASTSTGGDGGAGGGVGGGSGGTGGEAAAVEWPTVESAIKKDEAIEKAIDELLAVMTIEEKVGQMIQPEVPAITPDEVKEFHIGSVLNGGGGWPKDNKAATIQDWVTAADEYYNASIDTSGGGVGIPIIWGTDALHGQNKIKGATLFPHNIGLGAANNPDLMRQIGIITAKEVAVTGLDWTFAPCLAVVQDDRWGRTYESFSEDPAIVKALGGPIVIGLQGDPADSADLFNDTHIIATAKHFLGDGGTNMGDDQGDNLATEQELVDIHLQGYLSALAEGAQTVMASYNSWHGQKMHGHKYLLTDILKGKMGFDGFVVGDWNGHAQIPGCTNSHCPEAVNAGVDMLMTPSSAAMQDWKELHANLIKDVNDKAISMERIDDAVRRILRVKMRFGLLGPHKTLGAPSTRSQAGKTEVLGAAEHRAVARQAVRESLVLLKNKGGILPLAKTSKLLVAGKSANNIGNQSGGWTIDWQGASNKNEDFPGATSIYAGISSAVSLMGGGAILSEDGTGASDVLFDAAIVVIGETPYAEMEGDLTKGDPLSLENAKMHPEDLAVLDAIRTSAPALPIITVFISGRPLYVNKELNRSDAFVAAWLPGSEGGGVADVLFGDHEFKGKLSFSWPASECQAPLNKGDEGALFPFGFGLTTADADTLKDDLSEESKGGCWEKLP